jgi:hypothetical protein
MTGNFDPSVVQSATQAAQILNKFYQQKAAKMNEAADSFLDPSMYNPHEAAQVLGRELPGFKERHADMFGAAPPPSSGAPVPVAGDNPDDPNATGPLPEDPSAAELGPATGGRPSRVSAPPSGSRITREAAIAEARRRGLIK